MAAHTRPILSTRGPAFYAAPRFLQSRRAREWWTVLHPPYTALHLSLVTIGACLSAPTNAVKLVATLGAFLLAVGVGAHSLDELNGRPLATTIPGWQLVGASTLGLGGAVALGVVGMIVVSPYLAAFIVVGFGVALAYNLELFGGRLHTGTVLVLSWGAFPVLTAYFAQHGTLSAGAVGAAIFGALLTRIQRQLSTPARVLRRRTRALDGTIEYLDGESRPITRASLLAPLEDALRTLCWAGPVLALTLAAVRFS
ncbi:MAG TPA: hypothetical protein PLS29_03390 [Acidimicrobiales bacterium]|nr:hypothetical protein [Acidimicrobiales bacterium]